MYSSGKKLKVALGMSGGVDSSLCAHLLKEQGYDVTGVYLECWKAPGCRSEEDRKDALKVALSLDIPFQVLDFIDAYKNKVVEYFFTEYEKGKTPNPDVMCNKEIKFGLFYDWAMENGFDYVATGHYAAVAEVPTFNFQAPNDYVPAVLKKTTSYSPQPTHYKHLSIPADKHKDQTYFLYLMKPEQLEHTLFPLATFTKDRVREEAENRGIHVSSKKDSVGICFIGDINVHQFLKDRLGENPGNVVDTQGNIIGTHKGLWFYTIGQRGGFEIQAKTLIKQSDGSLIDRQNIPPFYVIRKVQETNELVVGFGSETLRDTFTLKNPYWTNPRPFTLDANPFMVRIRHTGQLLPCSLSEEDTGIVVKLNEPTKGLAEGQAAVFYKKLETGETICLGGGEIG